MRPPLKERVLRGVAARLGRMTPETSARVDYELARISAVGCEELFVKSADLVEVVRAAGGVVGPGFGRVPASFVAYALEITDVNPLVRKGLVFELFLYSRRPKPPRLLMNLDRIGFDAAFRHLKAQPLDAGDLPHIIYEPALDNPKCDRRENLPSDDLVHAAVLELPGHEQQRDLFVRNVPGEWEELHETHGAIFYDEQVVLLAMSQAGFSAREAVALWRAARKCDQETLDRLLPHFLIGCRGRLTEEQSRRLFAQIVTEGRYAMSRAHYVAATQLRV